MYVLSGTRLWNKVYAVDTVGHQSVVVVSDGVTVDTSAPVRKSVAYLGTNLLENPSFEENSLTESETACNLVIPASWQTDAKSCIRLIVPESALARDGTTVVSVSGTIKQTVTGLEVGKRYKVTIHTGYPETILNHHKAVEATVAVGGEVFSFTLDPNLCKGTCQVGDHTIIMWNKHTYMFTATATSTDLEISTTSRTMELVLDHVTLQTVDYVSGGQSTEGHLMVHSVFLSHWSYIHASWHFEDVESPITEYRVAVGKV